MTDTTAPTAPQSNSSLTKTAGYAGLGGLISVLVIWGIGGWHVDPVTHEPSDMVVSALTALTGYGVHLVSVGFMYLVKRNAKVSDIIGPALDQLEPKIEAMAQQKLVSLVEKMAAEHQATLMPAAAVPPQPPNP